MVLEGHNSFRRMDEVSYSYDGKFEGNILIVGRTGCGETTVVQNLGKNKLFGDIKEVYWISKIELPNVKRKKLDCFKDQNVGFKYPKNIDFNDLLKCYQQKKSHYNENYLGETMILDDVSGLADRSEDFGNFLAVSRKYGLTFAYIFHTIYLTRQHWQVRLSQRKIFNLFPGSVQVSAII